MNVTTEEDDSAEQSFHKLFAKTGHKFDECQSMLREQSGPGISSGDEQRTSVEEREGREWNEGDHDRFLLDQSGSQYFGYYSGVLNRRLEPEITQRTHL